MAQESVINATGDIDGTLEAFRDTLQRFVNGEGQLDSLLQKAGLDATSDEMRPVVAYAAREMVKKGQASEEQYSAKTNAMVEKDKYLDAVMDRWDPSDDKRGRFRFGRIKPGSAYEKVGLRPGTVYMDQSKVKAALEKHGDHITKEVIKQIPEMLNDPKVIAEPTKKDVKNTVNVFVEMEVGKEYPLMIALMMKPGITGDYWVDIVRSVELRSDYERLINGNSVLWVNPNIKKEPILAPWLENLNVLSAASKDGFVRSITYEPESVNGKSFSLKSDSGTFFEELGADADAQEAGRLIDNLMASRGKMELEPGAWKGQTSAISKQILEETGSEYGQAALTGRINKAYEAIDRAGSDRAAIMSYCYDIGKTVAAKAGEAVQLDTGRQEARNYLRNTKIYLNAEMQSEVASAYGSVRAFMQRNFGKAKFTTNKNKSPANLLNFIPHNIASIYGT